VIIALIECVSIRDNGYHHVKGNCSLQVSKYLGTIYLFDVNRSGLQFTWNQKPRGVDGTLKKIDRIMANLGFTDLFLGAHAIFQPYRISDHSPPILYNL
jgi:hypothetical protein